MVDTGPTLPPLSSRNGGTHRDSPGRSSTRQSRESDKFAISLQGSLMSSLGEGSPRRRTGDQSSMPPPTFTPPSLSRQDSRSTPTRSNAPMSQRPPSIDTPPANSRPRKLPPSTSRSPTSSSSNQSPLLSNRLTNTKSVSGSSRSPQLTIATSPRDGQEKSSAKSMSMTSPDRSHHSSYLSEDDVTSPSHYRSGTSRYRSPSPKDLRSPSRDRRDSSPPRHSSSNSSIPRSRSSSQLNRSKERSRKSGSRRERDRR